VREKLGPTWGQNNRLLGPKPCASGGKGNGLNGTFGRGGGDRKLAYSNKPHCFMALQPPFRNNWYKRYKLAAGDGNRTQNLILSLADSATDRLDLNFRIADNPG
jgi:hypothetical protein